jgi:hypothetical protein
MFMEEYVVKTPFSPMDYMLGTEVEGPEDPTLMTVAVIFVAFWRTH